MLHIRLEAVLLPSAGYDVLAGVERLDDLGARGYQSLVTRLISGPTGVELLSASPPPESVCTSDTTSTTSSTTTTVPA